MSSPKKIKTSRELRLYPQQWPLDKEKEWDVLKWKDGFIRPEGSSSKAIEVLGRQLCLDFVTKDDSKGIYVDDLIAIARDMAISDTRPNVDKEEGIEFLNRAIQCFDKSAVKRHGYSGNEDEKNLKVPNSYLKMPNSSGFSGTLQIDTKE